MSEKKNDATQQWTRLCQELEAAKAAYQAAEASLACTEGPETKKQDALKASLQASKRMTEILEKMRKIITRQ